MIQVLSHRAHRCHTIAPYRAPLLGASDGRDCNGATRLIANEKSTARAGLAPLSLLLSARGKNESA